MNMISKNCFWTFQFISSWIAESEVSAQNCSPFKVRLDYIVWLYILQISEAFNSRIGECKKFSSEQLSLLRLVYFFCNTPDVEELRSLLLLWNGKKKNKEVKKRSKMCTLTNLRSENVCSFFHATICVAPKILYPKLYILWSSAIKPDKYQFQTNIIFQLPGLPNIQLCQQSILLWKDEF